ncbi:MAG TPA: DNA polymerase III subunit delta [Solirubrobacteraceae bacterium]|nr:DNA polymerase III subunit delta [Solirubrobacteraceae bacterium]
MPSFKAAYLIHGDDHGRISERRTRLRAMAEAESGTAGVEVFENDACTPEAVTNALSAMTFAIGRRFVIADGVERWKDADAEQVAAALAGVDPESLTVAFFAREEGRFKVPESLVKAVKAADGAIAEESQVKPRELPRWLSARAKELELDLDNQAARALIAQVGDRQQRLLRELEKLALEHGPGTSIGVEEVQESCASSAERKVWTFADAVVAGDRKTAMRLLMELRGQGERLPGLLYNMVRRLRDALAIAEALAAGQPPAQIKKGLRMPGFAADRLIADAQRRDVDAYRRALVLMADLEAESRGHGGGGLEESTAAVRTVIAAAS